MLSSFGRALLLVLLFLAAVTSEVWAQGGTGGGLRGTVRDETGGTLAGVTVEAASPARIGGAAVEVTNSEGRYVFENLPIGMYTVTFTLSGFTAVRREDIRVEAGRSIELAQALKVGAVQESVTVAGQTPVVDTVNAGTSTNFNREMLQNIPTTRSQYFDTISYMPGVKSGGIGGSSPSIFGSPSRQNAIKYEGLDMSDASYGGPFDWINYDMMQEIEVKAVGASAEHAGFQGGVINIILKSATNTWRGSASFYGQWQPLIGNNTPDAPFPGNLHHRHDVNFDVGGPIREGIWVQYLNQNIHSRQTGFGQDPNTTLSSPTVRWEPYIKVNARLSDADQIQAHFNDSFDRWGGSGSLTAPLHTGNTEMGNDPVASAGWNRVMGSSTLLEVKYGGLYVRKWRPPTSRDFQTSRHFDEFTGNRSVNSGYADRWHRNRSNVDAALSHATRAHEMKFGIQTSQALVITYTGWAQNVQYFDYNGQPSYARFQEPDANAGRLITAGAFAQDNWRLGDRLTLNAGIRFDRTLGEVPEAQQYDYTMKTRTGKTFPGVSDVVSWSDVSPRIGGVYKIDPLGKTVMKASVGRYYSKLTTNMFGTLSPGATAQHNYYYYPATRQYDVFWYSQEPVKNYGIDPELTNYYTDQYSVGLERELLSNFGLSASWIYKKDGNPIAVKDVGGVYVERPYVDTFEGQTETITVYNRVSPSAQSLFMVTNRPEFDRSYKSFIIEANKRWSGGGRRSRPINGSGWLVTRSAPGRVRPGSAAIRTI